MGNSYSETFKAQVKGKKWSTKVHITNTDWSLQVDEPVEEGGTNSGPNPMQYFITALAGCQNEQAQVIAKELSLSISQIDINIELDLDLSGFIGLADNSIGSYKTVRLNAVISGEINDSQVKTLGDKVDVRCPVLVLLRSSGCKVESSWSKK